MDSERTAREVLEEYFKNSSFDSPLSSLPRAPFYTVPLGPFTIDIPNTGKRNQLVVHHDLHHIITGYKTTRLGEGEIGAWELGTGLLRWPVAMLLNFGGMVTGVYLSPKKTWVAYKKGVTSRSLYRIPESELLEKPFTELQNYVATGGGTMNAWHYLRFGFFFAACGAVLLLSPLAALASKLVKKYYAVRLGR